MFKFSLVKLQFINLGSLPNIYKSIICHTKLLFFLKVNTSIIVSVSPKKTIPIVLQYDQLGQKGSEGELLKMSLKQKVIITFVMKILILLHLIYQPQSETKIFYSSKITTLVIKSTDQCNKYNFYYTSQYFSLQAPLFCCNKIFSFCFEANVLAVVKNLFFYPRSEKSFCITSKRDYHVPCEVCRVTVPQVTGDNVH